MHIAARTINCLGRKIDSWDELATNACNPEWKITQQKRGDDNGDIDSCLPIS